MTPERRKYVRYVCTVCGAGGADAPGRSLRCHECPGGPYTMQEQK